MLSTSLPPQILFVCVIQVYICDCDPLTYLSHSVRVSCLSYCYKERELHKELLWCTLICVIFIL